MHNGHLPIEERGPAAHSRLKITTVGRGLSGSGGQTEARSGQGRPRSRTRDRPGI